MNITSKFNRRASGAQFSGFAEQDVVVLFPEFRAKRAPDLCRYVLNSVKYQKSLNGI